MVLSIKARRPQSIAGRLWNLAQNVSPVAELAFIVLKLVGLIAWSWWWVLAPPRAWCRRPLRLSAWFHNQSD